MIHAALCPCRSVSISLKQTTADGRPAAQLAGRDMSCDPWRFAGVRPPADRHQAHEPIRRRPGPRSWHPASAPSPRRLGFLRPATLADVQYALLRGARHCPRTNGGIRLTPLVDHRRKQAVFRSQFRLRSLTLQSPETRRKWPRAPAVVRDLPRNAKAPAQQRCTGAERWFQTARRARGQLRPRRQQRVSRAVGARRAQSPQATTG